MPLRPARRLPKKFRRPVSKETKRVVLRKHRHARKRVLMERVRRFQRRITRSAESMKRTLIHWVLGIFIALLLFVIGFVIFSPVVEVREIRIVRTSPRLDIEEVQQILAPLFHRRLFFLQKREVEQMLEHAILDIEHIDVAKVYPSELYVEVTLSPLNARLMIINPEDIADVTITGSTIDYITVDGIYVEAPFAEQDDFLPTLRLVDWSVRPTPGTQLVTAEFLQTLEETRRRLYDQFGQTVLVITVFLRSQEYHFTLENGSTLWFDVQSPLEMQLKNYQTFLQSIDAATVKEYIDLRLSDRVIYK